MFWTTPHDTWQQIDGVLIDGYKMAKWLDDKMADQLAKSKDVESLDESLDHKGHNKNYKTDK